MRLTDVVEAKDLMNWFRGCMEKGITPNQLSVSVFSNWTPELQQLAETFACCGFYNLPEMKTLLQFLDEAIQHKTQGCQAIYANKK